MHTIINADGEEYCPFCDVVYPYTLDKTDKCLEVVCPGCGKKLMLCSECEGRCDWKGGGCKRDRNHVKAWWKV